MSLLSNFRSFSIQLPFLSLSAIRSWLSAPTFMAKAVDLQRRSLLLLRLLFMAAPAAALHGCSCGCSSWLLLRLLFMAAPAAALRLLQRLLFWLPLWVLFPATSASALFGCLCCTLF